jgi:phenylacetate-CoA ligase
MLKRFPPKIASIEELPAHQLRGLQWTVRHAAENSSFYRERLAAAGVAPDDIKSLDDLRRIPFTTADDLAAGYPFALRSTGFGELVRIHASSGTTGKRKVLCYTQKDVDDWQDMFARCYELAGLTREDRVQIAVGCRSGRGTSSCRPPS